jgi:glutathione S-transferase
VSNFVNVSDAKQQGGLRVALTTGAPGPWGEAIKGMLHVKKIPFLRVAQEAGGENSELVAWTGIRNAPQLIDEEDHVLHAWSDLVHFAERRAPDPPLIPDDLEDRIAMFGLIHEIAGEDGFAWKRRMCLFKPIMELAAQGENPAFDGVRRMAESYDYNEEDLEGAPSFIANLLNHLNERLVTQHAAGSHFLVGDRLSALDIYWAAFAGMIAPMSSDRCPMPDYLRASYSALEPIVAMATTPELKAHRDYIYETYMELPVKM